jgi:hypothetical protein
MREDALIPLRFFRNGTFSVTAAGGFLVGMGMFGGLALLPLYLQIVRGATPTESGLELLPLTAGIMVGSLISGRAISRTGKYKAFPILEYTLTAGAAHAEPVSRKVSPDSPGRIDFVLTVGGVLTGNATNCATCRRASIPSRPAGTRRSPPAWR